jgi:hypothetical protein
LNHITCGSFENGTPVLTVSPKYMAGSFAGCWAKENVEQNRADTKNRNLTIIEYLLMITMLGIVFGTF